MRRGRPGTYCCCAWVGIIGLRLRLITAAGRQPPSGDIDVPGPIRQIKKIRKETLILALLLSTDDSR
jgi:hypothetical protein